MILATNKAEVIKTLALLCVFLYWWLMWKYLWACQARTWCFIALKLKNKSSCITHPWFTFHASRAASVLASLHGLSVSPEQLCVHSVKFCQIGSFMMQHFFSTIGHFQNRAFTTYISFRRRSAASHRTRMGPGNASLLVPQQSLLWCCNWRLWVETSSGLHVRNPLAPMNHREPAERF